jgi:O-antigen/teichoic acid export membrane protein
MNKISKKIKCILTKNKNLSSVASGDFISSALGALFWLYIAVLLTPEEYGEISYVISIAAFASTLSMLGAYNSIVVLTAKNIRIQSTINLISSSTGLIAALIVFLTVNKSEIGFLIFAYIFTNLAIPYILGKKQFNNYFKIIVLSKILAVSSSIILFYLIGHVGIIIGLSTPLIIFGFKIFQIFKNIKIDFGLLKKHSRFIMTNYIMNISESISGSLDKIIIVPILGFAVLGGYQLGLQFFGILVIIPGIVYKITLPDDSQGILNKTLKIRTIFVTFGFGVLSFILIPEIIPILNSSYNESILPIQIIALSSIPASIALMYLSRFIGSEKNRILLAGSAIYASALISLIIILGMYLDSFGLSVGFFVAQCISMTYFICVDYFLKERGVKNKQ